VRQPAGVVGCFLKNSKTKPSMKILIESDGQGGLSYDIQGDAAQLSSALKVAAYYDTELLRALNQITSERQIRIAEEVANISDASVGKVPAGERHQPKI
jgi:hypothetical protein